MTELCELYARLAEYKAPPGVTILNGVFADATPLIADDVAAHLARDGAAPTVKRAAEDLRVLRAWSKRAAREQARLAPAAAAAGWPVLPLPFVLRGTDNSDSTLAGMLADLLAGKAPVAMGGAR